MSYLYYAAADGGLGLSEQTATSIVGAYGGAVYPATILGAWAADRLLGPERVLFVSAVGVMVRHISLAVLPGLTGMTVAAVGMAIGLVQYPLGRKRLTGAAAWCRTRCRRRAACRWRPQSRPSPSWPWCSP